MHAAHFFDFSFFLLCAALFCAPRLPATLRAEARRRACLPACCVRLLRARAAAAALFRLLLLLLVLPLPLLVGAAAAASIKFCVQPTAAAFPLLLPARGQAFAGAGFSPEGAAAYARKKPSWYVAARFCALTLCFGAYARVCALYERAPFTFSIFIFQAKRAQHAQHAHTHTLARWLSAFPCASRPLRPLYRCVLPRARVRGPPLPVFLVLRAFPLPLSCCAAWPTLRAPPPLLLLLAAAPPPALCARAPTPATACAANPARFFW